MIMTALKRALINAGIIAAITFISTLSIDYPPTAQNLWAAFIGASLAMLTQLRSILDSDDIKNPPLGMLI